MLNWGKTHVARTAEEGNNVIWSEKITIYFFGSDRIKYVM